MELQLNQLSQEYNIAFVLGNGTSRLNTDAKQLLQCGVVYGCNAQYREFAPHYLIAVDLKMVNEIVSSGYNKSNQVWTNPNRGTELKSNLNFFNPNKGWSSGPTALWFASTHQHTTIFILGFDYLGTEGKFNNVYANTANYKKSSDFATYYGNWLSQTETVIKEFGNIKYCRVIDESTFIPDRLSELKNLSHISYQEFEKSVDCIKSFKMNQKSTI
jgi:hypothetical protein